MPSIPLVPLYDVSAARAIDRHAVQVTGIDDFVLMTRAARAALASLRRAYPAARTLLVACGGGNNGGDGFVLARLAREAGLSVRVVMPELREGSSDAARRAQREWREGNGDVVAFDAGFDIDATRADVIVDALFGIGLSRASQGAAARLIERMNASSAPIVALDVPSGVDADTGAVSGVAVRATLTVTFIVDKRGLATGAALNHVGRVELAPLSLDVAAMGVADPCAHRLGESAVRDALPPRPRDSHKGHHGHVLVIGGDHGTAGAVRLAAEAALRSGAGLVSVATRRENLTPLLAARPELMAHAVDGADALQALIDRADVLAVGPGLGTDAWGGVLLDAALASGKPLVLDADALNLVARAPRRLHDAVITPHPGEAARLLGIDTAAVQRDRFAAAARLAQRYGCGVVLKGAGSIAAALGASPEVIAAGNAGMASGGMGDALTGIVAALRGQGLAAFDAARIGMLVHAMAGDVAAREGQRGLLAGDLIDALRGMVNP